MEYWIPNDMCTGCAACTNACRREAISLPYDERGFAHPVINQSRCNDCDACRVVCPVSQALDDRPSPVLTRSGDPTIYAAWSRDAETRYNSTSGGVFSEFARALLAQGALIAGAAYTDDCMVRHVLIDDENGLAKIRQSKYVQSDIALVYRDVKKQLREGKTVFFCGAPCQVAGLYTYLRKEPANLITADFICRGVNSPVAYRAWLDDLESEYGARATRVWFKNKEVGWNRFSTRVDFANGRKYRKTRYEDLFMRGYLEKNLFIRPACSQCQVKGFPRQGDITLADFWGIDKTFDSDQGTSMVIVNSDKGARLLELASGRLVVHERTLEEAKKGNAALDGSVKQGAMSEAFFGLLAEGVGYTKAFKMIADETQPLVSVIIHMPRRSASLRACARMIIAQDYQNLEILLVCTTPDPVSQEFAEEIAASDERVRLFMSCGDANSARNEAIAAAKGTYFHFCSGYEMLPKTFYSTLVAAAEEAAASVSCFGSSYGKTIMHSYNAFSGTGTSIGLIDLILTGSGPEDRYSGYGYALNNKLFHRDAVFIEGEPILFGTHQYGLTDLFWLVKVGINSRRALFNAKPMFKVGKAPTLPQAHHNMVLRSFFEYEDDALQAVGNLNSGLYTKLQRACYDYEIALLVSADSQGLAHLCQPLREHILNYHEVPVSKEEIVDICCQSERVKRDRVFLKDKVRQMTADVEPLTTENERLRGELTTRTEDIRWLQERKGRLEEERRSLRGEAKQLRGLLDARAEDIRWLQERKSGLEEERERLRGQLAARLEDIRWFQERKSGLEEDRQQLRAEVNQLRVDLRRANGVINARSADIQWLQERKGSLEQERQQLRAEVRQYCGLLNARAEDIRWLQERRTQLEADRERLRTREKGLESQLTDLHSSRLVRVALFIRRGLKKLGRLTRKAFRRVFRS